MCRGKITHRSGSGIIERILRERAYISQGCEAAFVSAASERQISFLFEGMSARAARHGVGSLVSVEPGSQRRVKIVYCASSINPPPSPISPRREEDRQSPCEGESSPCGRRARIPGWKVMLYRVPTNSRITCRINAATLPAFVARLLPRSLGVSKRQHELMFVRQRARAILSLSLR